MSAPIVMENPKDPDAVLDYTWDWSKWLSASETISTATVVAVTPGISVLSSSVVGSTVVAWIGGGTAGETYRVRCHITTNQSRADDRTISIRVEER